MRRLAVLATGAILLSPTLGAQAPSDELQPVATMKQLMVDIIHPAANAIILVVNRGGPGDEKEWAEVRRSSMTLAESGNLLIMRNRAPSWVADAKRLTDVGTASYKAADSKDATALAALTGRLDSSCTMCHQHFRPVVFPPAR